jgi:hypothetical protein
MIRDRQARANKRARRGFVGLLTHVGGLSGQCILSLLLLAADSPTIDNPQLKLWEETRGSTVVDASLVSDSETSL